MELKLQVDVSAFEEGTSKWLLDNLTEARIKKQKTPHGTELIVGQVVIKGLPYDLMVRESSDSILLYDPNGEHLHGLQDRLDKLNLTPSALKLLAKIAKSLNKLFAKKQKEIDKDVAKSIKFTLT